MKNNTPLTVEELHERIGFVVGVTDLGFVDPDPLPAVVWEWHMEDPFSADFHLDKRVRELTAIQPAGWAGHTKYWKVSEYGKTWLAYEWNNKP